MDERSGDLTSALRAIGGVLLAIGAVVVLARRSSHHRWSDFELLLTVAIPAAALFALAVAGRSGVGAGPADPARAVLLVSAVLLSPIVFLQFLVWAGAGHHLLYDAAVLAASAGVAIAGARRAGAPYAMFLAGLALLGAWVAVWLKILHPASADDVRGILLSGGVVLILAAGAVSLAGAAGSAELATAGGLGAVVAGLQGVLIGLFGVTLAPFVSIMSSSGSNGSEIGPLHRGGRGETPDFASGAPHIAGGQTVGWNVYLLVVSLALVWCGSRSRLRGPAYVGFLGLAAFLLSVGAQLTRLEAGREPTGSLLGWPLILVLLGLAGLAAPLVRRRAP